MADTAHRNLQIEYVDPHSLHPAAYNPRVIDPEELAKLRRSIGQWGMVDALVARKEDRTLIAGHQRLAIAVEQQMAEVPVVFLDISPHEARALNVALNRIHGDWDLPKLSALLSGLRDLPDIDETLTGFTHRDMDQLLGDLEAKNPLGEQEEQFDVTSELSRSEPRIHSGECWILGHHRLLCGDALEPGSLERALGGEQADLLLTDPPYGIGYESKTLQASGMEVIANDVFDGWESFLERAMVALKPVLKQGATFYWFAAGGAARPALALSLLAVSRHFRLLDCLVWDREAPGFGQRWRHSWEAIIEAAVGEPACWHGGEGRRNVLRYPRPAVVSEGHPTPKPAGLLAELIRCSSEPGSLVLDPFSGAGSTLVAAERTGRRCCVVELEPRYAELTLRRWERMTEQTAQREA